MKNYLNDNERQLDISDNLYRCNFSFIEIVLSCLISLFFGTGQSITLTCLDLILLKWNILIIQFSNCFML